MITIAELRSAFSTQSLTRAAPCSRFVLRYAMSTPMLNATTGHPR